MGKLIDLTGQRFGRLVVIKRVENKGAKTAWLCECDCGKRIIAATSNLTRGKTKSCGCLKRDVARKTCAALPSGGHFVHGGTGTRLFQIWRGMKGRCYNSGNGNYSNYGGRGITVCDEWKDNFPAFREWALANGYAENLSIDRINNDKGYSPDNCRWATVKEQNNNRRPRRWGKKPKTE